MKCPLRQSIQFIKNLRGLFEEALAAFGANQHASSPKLVIILLKIIRGSLRTLATRWPLGIAVAPTTVRYAIG